MVMSKFICLDNIWHQNVECVKILCEKGADQCCKFLDSPTPAPEPVVEQSTDAIPDEYKMPASSSPKVAPEATPEPTSEEPSPSSIEHGLAKAYFAPEKDPRLSWAMTALYHCMDDCGKGTCKPIQNVEDCEAALEMLGVQAYGPTVERLTNHYKHAAPGCSVHHDSGMIWNPVANGKSMQKFKSNVCGCYK
jgi:hypothetical protein